MYITVPKMSHICMKVLENQEKKIITISRFSFVNLGSSGGMTRTLGISQEFLMLSTSTSTLIINVSTYILVERLSYNFHNPAIYNVHQKPTRGTCVL